LKSSLAIVLPFLNRNFLKIYFVINVHNVYHVRVNIANVHNNFINYSILYFTYLFKYQLNYWSTLEKMRYNCFIMIVTPFYLSIYIYKVVILFHKIVRRNETNWTSQLLCYLKTFPSKYILEIIILKLLRDINLQA